MAKDRAARGSVVLVCGVCEKKLKDVFDFLVVVAASHCKTLYIIGCFLPPLGGKKKHRTTRRLFYFLSGN